MELWRLTATKLGEELAKKHNIQALPVNPFEIAADLGIAVEALPPENNGVSGMLLYSNNNFGIMYSTYFDNRGFEHFSIGHEIGHYSIEGHPENILVEGQHISYAGFASTNRYELEADHFSAGLLMPGYLFDRAIRKFESGFKAVYGLMNLCETSIVSTAIRYAQRTKDVAAIIVSNNTHIEYCFMSGALKEIKGLRWIKKGALIPKDTLTYQFNQKLENIRAGRFSESDTSLLHWFESEQEIDAYEEVKGLGAYGKSLTVITVDELPDAEDNEFEDELAESWTPKFKR